MKVDRTLVTHISWLLVTAFLFFTDIQDALGKKVSLSDKLNFSVKFKDEVNPYRVLGIFLKPGERIELECVFTTSKSTFTISAQKGNPDLIAKERWRWTAPREQGLYPITITEKLSQMSMKLQVFVMVPFAPQHQKLNGYRIGQYPLRPLKNNPVYAPPTALIEVTEHNRNEHVSPHFTLGQFISKQAGGYPKYLALRERLLLKLEMILEAVKEQGIQLSTLHVMSGFRTPFYNKAIGNPTQYSRHLYGDAADIFVDRDQNNVMDDLNGDGKSTFADAQTLADLIVSQSKKTWYRPFVGGLGIYGPRSHRGPFVHVDVRGYPARWTNP